MATAREIRRRMSSVRNIRQITRAMELIAVTRLRRAQQRVLASRPYAAKMRDVLAQLVERVSPSESDAAAAGAAVELDETSQAGREQTSAVMPPLLVRRPVHRVGVVVLTTERGLCGALNSNIIRRTLQFAHEQQNQRREVDFIVVGRKGLQALRRLGVNIVAEFTQLGDYPPITRTSPIARVAMDAFTSGQVDEVALVYPRFISTLRQEPTVVPLLPIEPPARDEDEARPATEVDYIYEPDPRRVLAALLPRYIEVQVYQAVLEVIASEFSAKMVAMRNATDNAGELLNDLQLGFNKARQATITREIIEVSAGATSQR
jgi:F-type H+-transporting ATPase subunit gamma